VQTSTIRKIVQVVWLNNDSQPILRYDPSPSSLLANDSMLYITILLYHHLIRPARCATKKYY